MPGQRLKPVGRVSAVGVCLFVVLLVAGYEIQQHREEPPTPDPRSFPVSPQSPEARLAAIQLGYLPRWKDSTTRRFVFLLDVLGADCPADTRRDLADLTVRSIRELHDSGIPASPTQVLGGVEGAEQIGALPDCSAFFESYVDLRRKGETSQP
jgi:hypothetical protein